MKNWKDTIVLPSTPILHAIEFIDRSSLGIVLVIDHDNKLLGTVTDGDIRRGILKGLKLDQSVDLVMNSHPTVARSNESRRNILRLMKQKQLSQIPVVDENGYVIRLEVLAEIIKTEKKENVIVLMAGGLGQRLYPLTNDCPKPLLRVGSRPILETILNNFIEHGFYRFYIAVNYKATMIEEYFGDGSKWDVQISYLRERDKLGTAGALSLLEKEQKEPIIVMNGDLLTKVNFNHLLDFHNEQMGHATMCVREYTFQVPYGVVQLDKQHLTGIVEKPIQNCFVSAGIYVLEPEALRLIPSNEYYDMPQLYKQILDNGSSVTVFPIREYWIDIGRISDFERANMEYTEVFG